MHIKSSVNRIGLFWVSFIFLSLTTCNLFNSDKKQHVSDERFVGNWENIDYNIGANCRNVGFTFNDNNTFRRNDAVYMGGSMKYAYQWDGSWNCRNDSLFLTSNFFTWDFNAGVWQLTTQNCQNTMVYFFINSDTVRIKGYIADQCTLFVKL